MKKIIGIIPTIRWDTSDNPYEDRYEFVDLYSQKLFQAGAIPIGLVLNEKQIDLKQLELCDAYLWPGGKKINKNLYQILYYAYLNKKPVLGICMGMQAMSIFSVMMEEIQNHNLDIKKVTQEQWLEIYQEMINTNPTLVKIENDNTHNNEITRTEYVHALHPITIANDSFLAKVYGDKKDVLHLHGMKVNRVGSLFKPVAYSEDNVIEAIESCNSQIFWLGLQFHPEYLNNDNFFPEWIKKINKK